MFKLFSISGWLGTIFAMAFTGLVTHWYYQPYRELQLFAFWFLVIISGVSVGVVYRIILRNVREHFERTIIYYEHKLKNSQDTNNQLCADYLIRWATAFTYAGENKSFAQINAISLRSVYIRPGLKYLAERVEVANIKLDQVRSENGETEESLKLRIEALIEHFEGVRGTFTLVLDALKKWSDNPEVIKIRLWKDALNL